MPEPALNLTVLPERLAVVRRHVDSGVPDWAMAGTTFGGVLRRGDELSLVCQADRVPEGEVAWLGLRALEVGGPFDFDATGVLASIAGPLADAGVWLFALATYDTDVVLVKESQLDAAAAALEAAGHRVSRLS